MKKLALLAAAALFAPGLALAQTSVAAGQSYVPPALPNTTPSDLVQDLPQGNPAVGNKYVTLGQIAGAPSYTLASPLTGASLTFANNQDLFELTPAGTISTLTVTLAPAPSDGQTECINTSQTVTTLTVNANTGQTLVTANTSPLAIGVSQCWQYVASNASWYRYR